MADLYESYSGPGDTPVSNGLANFYTGQTFTPSVSHTITSVKLILFRSGGVGFPGIFTVEIYLADGAGKPTGSVKASGTSDGDTLTTNVAGEQREIILSPDVGGASLTSGLKYAIVVKAPSSDANNILNWNYKSGNGYAGGTMFLSNNGGSTWNTYADLDCDFEEWGTVGGGGSSGGGGSKMKIGF